MPTAETYDLYVLQMFILSGKDRGGEHPGMEVVDHIQTALAEIYLCRLSERIRRQYRDAKTL